MQYIIDLGKQLVNSLKYIEKRTNMKVKTSFLNLFVFDDIYTTGATANECAKAIRGANSNKIGVLTIAKD